MKHNVYIFKLQIKFTEYSNKIQLIENVQLGEQLQNGNTAYT